MREILFRGKDESGILNHSWQFGALDNTDEIFPKIIRLDRWGNKMIVNVVPQTVGQFTGLTENGKRIFEGDILKVKHGILGREEEKPKTPRNAYGLHYEENESGMFGRWFYYRNYVVEYKAHGNSRGKYIVRNGSDQCEFTNSLFLNHDAKIIGNIHDNPELLLPK